MGEGASSAAAAELGRLRLVTVTEVTGADDRFAGFDTLDGAARESLLCSSRWEF